MRLHRTSRHPAAIAGALGLVGRPGCLRRRRRATTSRRRRREHAARRRQHVRRLRAVRRPQGQDGEHLHQHRHARGHARRSTPTSRSRSAPAPPSSTRATSPSRPRSSSAPRPATRRTSPSSRSRACSSSSSPPARSWRRPSETGKQRRQVLGPGLEGLRHRRRHVLRRPARRQPQEPRLVLAGGVRGEGHRRSRRRSTSSRRSATSSPRAAASRGAPASPAARPPAGSSPTGWRT